jgi:hypothetical protein
VRGREQSAAGRLRAMAVVAACLGALALPGVPAAARAQDAGETAVGKAPATPGPAAVPAPPAAAPRAAGADPLEASSDVAVKVDVDADGVRVGRPFTVRFALSYPAGTRVYFPENPAVAPLVLVKAGQEAPAVLGAATGESHALTLLPVRTGTAVVPPIEVPYVSGDGQARTARTPEVRVQVGSGLSDQQAPELAAAGAPVAVRVRNTPLLLGIAGVAVALAAAVLGILGWRRFVAWRESRKPPPPPRPPRDVAVEKLARIAAQGLVEAGLYRELALQVSEVLREFLGGTYGFAGVDLTTWEVLRALERKDLGRLARPELEDFLSLCDLIKFAKYAPAPAEAATLIPRAREAVERVATGDRVVTVDGAGLGSGTGTGAA